MRATDPQRERHISDNKIETSLVRPTVGRICLLSRQVTVPLLRRGFRLYLAAPYKRNFIVIETPITLPWKRILAGEDFFSWHDLLHDVLPLSALLTEQALFFGVFQASEGKRKRERSARHARGGWWWGAENGLLLVLKYRKFYGIFASPNRHFRENNRWLPLKHPQLEVKVQGVWTYLEETQQYFFVGRRVPHGHWT